MASDSDPEKWDYPPHTKAKHDMLASYLDGWYPILSRWNGKILFLDGFAGRGKYTNGAEGSPIIALKRLINHRHFPRMGDREFVFMFVEANADNAASLKHEIDAFIAQNQPWPPKVKVYVENQKFDVTANGIIDYLREQKGNLAPTFAFVDPFGYSGLPMDLLADLLAYPKTEIFVNFMVGHVQRFIERDGQENAMKRLFGIDVRDVLAMQQDDDRVEHLRAVYENQLRTVAKFDFVQSFAMRNRTGNIGYYLFHGTRNRTGVKLMKAAMWKIDPGGGYSFSDRLAGDEVLFTPEPDTRPLQASILSTFAGRMNVLVDEIEWHAILYTPYRETHIRPILTELEATEKIRVRRPGKRGFPVEKTFIDFL